MTIINSSVVQGEEIKPTESATTTYLADQVVFSVAGVRCTQRQAITGVLAFLAAWALKD